MGSFSGSHSIVRREARTDDGDPESTPRALPRAIHFPLMLFTLDLIYFRTCLPLALPAVSTIGFFSGTFEFLPL